MSNGLNVMEILDKILPPALSMPRKDYRKFLILQLQDDRAFSLAMLQRLMRHWNCTVEELVTRIVDYKYIESGLTRAAEESLPGSTGGKEETVCKPKTS
jgi:hypothetical protein